MTLVNNPLETLDYVTASNVSVAASGEVIVATTDVIQANVNPSSQQPGSSAVSPQTVRPVILDININFTEGTTGTAFIVRVRQGTLVTGTLVPGNNTFTVTLAAAANGQFHFKVRDTSGVPVAGVGSAYVVTIQQTGATAVGTVNFLDVEVRQ